jgi:hypothetical protein
MMICEKRLFSTTNDWERQNYGNIIDRLSQLDRDINQRNKPAVIRVLRVTSETYNIIRSAEEKPGVCHYCCISVHNENVGKEN